MRLLAASILGLIAAAPAAYALPGGPAPLAAASAPAVTKIEYFCSPGFVPTYGGRCVATGARDEIELFVDQPVEERPVVHRRYRRHHGLREKY